jgi:hypothetical protein
MNVRFPHHPSKCGIRRARARFRVGKGEHPAHDPQSGVRLLSGRQPLVTRSICAAA